MHTRLELNPIAVRRHIRQNEETYLNDVIQQSTGCVLMGSVLISCFVKQTFLIEYTAKKVFETILAVNKFNVNKYGIRLLLSVLVCVFGFWLYCVQNCEPVFCGWGGGLWAAGDFGDLTASK